MSARLDPRAPLAALAWLLCGAAAAAEPPRWTLVVPPQQPIRILRALEERTPDASQAVQAQIQQGVNPWAQLLIYAVTQIVSNKMERANKAEQEEIVVPTDAAVGASTVAVADTGTQKTYQTQEDANRVIRPYAEALAGTSLHDLLAPVAPALGRHGLRLAGGVEAVPPAQVLQLAPRFVFATDQRSVSVDTVIGQLPPGGEPGAASAPAQGVAAAGVQALRVRVHSAAADALDIGDHWLKDGAGVLRSTFAGLLASALEIAAPRLAVAPAAGPATPARQRTFRFRLGGESLFVRGSLLQAGCEQVLVQSIEGLLVAAPAAALRDQELLPAECRRS